MPANNPDEPCAFSKARSDSGLVCQQLVFLVRNADRYPLLICRSIIKKKFPITAAFGYTLAAAAVSCFLCEVCVCFSAFFAVKSF
jgi:hypothetical protein